MQTKVIKAEDAKHFTEKELKELNDYLEDGGKSLTTDTANKYYQLFFEGSSVEEIHAAFPHIPKGALLLSRLEQRWDEKSQKEFVERVQKLPRKLMNAKVDIVELAAEQLSIAKAEYERQAKIYKQNPSRENIPRTLLYTPKELRELVNIINDATKLGEEKEGATVNINVSTGMSGSDVVDIDGGSRKVKKAKILSVAANSESKVNEESD